MIFRDKTKSMWADALDMLEQADRLQRQFFKVSQPGHAARPGSRRQTSSRPIVH